MNIKNIKADKYYSNGETVRKVSKVTDEYVVFHEARLTMSVTGAPTVVDHAEFEEWAQFEVAPHWAKVVHVGR